MNNYKETVQMKTLICIIFISLCTFFVSAQILIQPSDYKICGLNSDIGIFKVVCDTPSVSFEWQRNIQGMDDWEKINASMPAFNGYDSDIMTIADAKNYLNYEFRCVVYDYFTDPPKPIDTSEVVKIILVPKPEANFSYSTPCEGVAVYFYDESNPAGSSLEWNWDFGDGDNSIVQNPRHFYASSDDKTVRLIVTNENGCKDTIDKSLVTIPYNYNMLVLGPTAVCSNQSSDRPEDLFEIDSYDSSNTYTWAISDDVYVDTMVTGNKLWIHWGTVQTSKQVRITVEETNINSGCVTGYATHDVLLTTQIAPDPGEIIRKTENENRGVLIYIGEPAGSYTWGYTNIITKRDTINDTYKKEYCDFGPLNLDANVYWCETTNEDRLGCSTRTIYPGKKKRIPNVFAYRNIILMPNPVISDELRFILPIHKSWESYKIKIFSMSGQVVKAIVQNSSHSHTINISELLPGLYFFTACNDTGEMLVEKLIIQ